MSTLLRFLLSYLLSGMLSPVFALSETPSSDFTDNGDGTVSHKISGLIWKRCVEGMIWDSKTCTGQSALFNASEASKLTSNFAGQTDWRLPSITELQSIVEREAFNPSINIEVFPNTPARTTHSYTIPVNTQTYHNHTWQVDFQFGRMAPTLTLAQSVVRFVRGKPAIPIGQAYTPTQNFTDNGDGTLTDMTTGLTWKRCAEGLSWDGTTCVGIPIFFELGNATEIAETQTEIAKVKFAGYTDWRIPKVNELITIIEFNNKFPAINTTLFPNSPNFAFSASSCPLNNVQTCVYWDVGFTNTGEDAITRTEAEPFRGTGYVENGIEVPSLDNTIRLVRGKQGANALDSVSFDTTTQILILNDVQAGSAHYQANLQYDANTHLFSLKTSQYLAKQQYPQPALYDATTQNLVIPKVLIAGKNYKANLLNKNPINFIFSLISLEEIK